METSSRCTPAKRILFSGYAPVHFVCFLPVYQLLRRDPGVEVFLSGGFRKRDEQGGLSYSLEGFYNPFEVDRSRIISVEQMRREDFEVAVCAHTSDTLLPRSARSTIQIFHGVSFKNLVVREKALRFDTLCLPGLYHAELFRKHGLLRDRDTLYLVTGFPKADALVNGHHDRAAFLRRVGLSPERPTILFAPTGDKHNALETMGREVISAIDNAETWNLLIKPHDHPKKANNWFLKLAPFENDRVRIVRDRDIVPSLRAADLLLTDVSSVAVEYTLLDRPIVFIDVPRLLEKVRKRAPALDLDTYGRKIGAVVNRPEDLAAAIAQSLAHPQREQQLRQKMARHIFHHPGSASRRVAEVIRRAAGLSESLPPDVQVLQPEP